MTKSERQLIKEIVLDPCVRECKPKSLEVGEKICPKCNGISRYKVDEVSIIYKKCSFCKGEGKVTWTEEICGGK